MGRLTPEINCGLTWLAQLLLGNWSQSTHREVEDFFDLVHRDAESGRWLDDLAQWTGPLTVEQLLHELTEGHAPWQRRYAAYLLRLHLVEPYRHWRFRHEDINSVSVSEEFGDECAKVERRVLREIVKVLATVSLSQRTRDVLWASLWHYGAIPEVVGEAIVRHWSNANADFRQEATLAHSLYKKPDLMKLLTTSSDPQTHQEALWAFYCGHWTSGQILDYLMESDDPLPIAFKDMKKADLYGYSSWRRFLYRDAYLERPITREVATETLRLEKLLRRLFGPPWVPDDDDMLPVFQSDIRPRTSVDPFALEPFGSGSSNAVDPFGVPAVPSDGDADPFGSGASSGGADPFGKD